MQEVQFWPILVVPFVAYLVVLAVCYIKSPKRKVD